MKSVTSRFASSGVAILCVTSFLFQELWGVQIMMMTWQFSSKKLIVFDWMGCLACF